MACELVGALAAQKRLDGSLRSHRTSVRGPVVVVLGGRSELRTTERVVGLNSVTWRGKGFFDEQWCGSPQLHIRERLPPRFRLPAAE